MQTVLIAGGSGLIGRTLSKLLMSKGYRVVILTRGASHQTPMDLTVRQQQPDKAHWDPASQEIDAKVIGEADYIINLAGAGVADKRWTKKRKQEIIDSRVQSGRLIVKALTETPNKVRAVLNASGIGWYGEDSQRPAGKAMFTESDPADEGFLGDTCKQWEASIAPVTDLGKRLVIVRTGIVLDKQGGALAEFQKPVRWGVAAVLGDGKQKISWIHIEDICRMYTFLMEQEGTHGVFNGVAPEPCTNQQLTVMLGKLMKGSFYMPVHVPSFVLKTMLGELSVEILKSATVSSKKISDAGFQFLFPSLEPALKDLTA